MIVKFITMIKALLIASDDCKSCREWKPTLYKLAKEFNIEVEEAEDSDDEAVKRSVGGLPYTLFYEDDDYSNDIPAIGELLGNYEEEYAREQIRGFISKRKTCK